jgi:Na+-translocating ferredoxin:NAD+ oxidoreductase subunit C
MSLGTFKGSIYPSDCKEATIGLRILEAEKPKLVAIPLQQHIGIPCEPIVNVGDKVTIGQKIGEAQSILSSPVHSSISGTVKSITMMPDQMSGEVLSVVIESDEMNEVHPSVVPKGDIAVLEPKEIIEIIKEAGIVGMGGSVLPIHIKLQPTSGRRIDSIILNGTESEPYLTGDYALMIENAEDIVYGLKLLMKAAGASKAYIGILEDKKDAIDAMNKAAASEEGIKIVILQPKYPHGAENQLVFDCTGIEVPTGRFAVDMGVIVYNIQTAAQVAKTIKTGNAICRSSYYSNWQRSKNT